MQSVRRIAEQGWRSVTGFLRARRGMAAVEFALIATPFFGLLIAILETGIVFFAQEMLQTATTNAGRLIMTGQAQTQSLSATQFKNDVCAQATLLDCARVSVNVQTFSTFSAMTQQNPVNNGKIDSTKLNFVMGGPGDIVLVQVFYDWPLVTGPLNFDLSNLGNGDRLLVATAVFRNEPY